MAMFNSYVKLPEGMCWFTNPSDCTVNISMFNPCWPSYQLAEFIGPCSGGNWTNMDKSAGRPACLIGRCSSSSSSSSSSLLLLLLLLLLPPPPLLLLSSASLSGFHLACTSTSLGATSLRSHPIPFRAAVCCQARDSYIVPGTTLLGAVLIWYTLNHLECTSTPLGPPLYGRRACRRQIYIYIYILNHINRYIYIYLFMTIYIYIYL